MALAERILPGRLSRSWPARRRETRVGRPLRKDQPPSRARSLTRRTPRCNTPLSTAKHSALRWPYPAALAPAALIVQNGVLVAKHILYPTLSVTNKWLGST